MGRRWWSLTQIQWRQEYGGIFDYTRNAHGTLSTHAGASSDPSHDVFPTTWTRAHPRQWTQFIGFSPGCWCTSLTPVYPLHRTPPITIGPRTYFSWAESSLDVLPATGRRRTHHSSLSRCLVSSATHASTSFLEIILFLMLFMWSYQITLSWNSMKLWHMRTYVHKQTKPTIIWHW